MNEFILDLITARGWSIRHLGELTGISYSGIRDYLKGLPQRLSKDRLSRVLDLLELDMVSGLKSNTLYTWRIEIQENRLAALNRVLQVTIERHSKPDTDTNASPKTYTQNKFEAIPLLGGDTDGLPAPYWMLRWKEIYILIQWRLPAASQVKKIPNFHDQNDKNSHDLPIVHPDIKKISSVCWASGMEISTEKVIGIQLTTAQLSQLKKCDTTETLKLETLKAWLQTKPTEDYFWAAAQAMQQEPVSWTWEMVLQRLKHRYIRPEEAAKILKLK